MGQDGEQKPLIENVSREVLQKALADGGKISPEKSGEAKPPEPKKPPPGCVERILNFKDRNYLVGACIVYCDQKGRGTYANRKKLDQIRKLVNFEATEEHTNEINDALAEDTLRWEGAREKYRTWRRYQEGLLSEKELFEKYPDIDLKKGVPKPPVQPPKLDPAVQRGPESTFHLPAKLDAWVQEALATMEWKSSLMTEFAVELYEKYGLHLEPGVREEKQGSTAELL